MAKNKQKKSQMQFIGPLTLKSTNKRAKRTRPQRSKMGGNHALHEAVCSVYDPFCPGAIGAKLPDKSTANTLTFHTKSIASINTNALGNAFIWVGPDPVLCVNVGTVDAGGVVTAYSSLSNDFFTTIVNTGGASQWRVVSYGCRYYTTAPWTTATGLLVTSEVSGNYSTVSLPNITTMTMGSVAKSMPVRDANVQFTGRARGIESEDFEQTSGADLGFTTFTMGFSGCAVSSVVGYLEVVINYEWIPAAYTGYVGLATPSAKHSPLVMDARANVSTNTPPILHTGSLEQARSAMSNASTVANEITSTIGTANTMYQSVKPLLPYARAAGKLLLL